MSSSSSSSDEDMPIIAMLTKTKNNPSSGLYSESSAEELLVDAVKRSNSTKSADQGMLIIFP
jgi:hypothetical protein